MAHRVSDQGEIAENYIRQLWPHFHFETGWARNSLFFRCCRISLDQLRLRSLCLSKPRGRLLPILLRDTGSSGGTNLFSARHIGLPMPPPKCHHKCIRGSANIHYLDVYCIPSSIHPPSKRQSKHFKIKQQTPSFNLLFQTLWYRRKCCEQK